MRDWRPADASSRTFEKQLCSLLECPPFLQAPSLAGYIAIRQEPDLSPLLQYWLDRKKQLFLPVWDTPTASYALAEVKGLNDTWLTAGAYDIPEPRQSLPRRFSPFDGTPALWLVPGLAFTRKGRRLGRGGGFYDRLLQNATGIRIGICYEAQILEEESLPVLPHDRPMDWLLTENGLFTCLPRPDAG